MGLPKTIVTNHSFQISSQCWCSLANNDGFAIIAHFDGDDSMTLPTLTSQFAAGCILINTRHTANVSTTTAIWVNTGSPTTPSWTSLTIS